MTENETEQVEPQDVGASEAADAPAPGPAAAAAQRPGRKVRIGVVTSDKMDKTVTVSVVRRFAHPLYGKGVKRTTRLHAHDEKNEFRLGDTVRIVETRPLSKTKRWRVVELVDRQA